MIARRHVIAGLCLSTGWPADMAFGAVAPKPGPKDPRIQYVSYDPDEVIKLRVAFGYALTIELSPDEKIESIALGNAGAWQATPNHEADYVFVKPMQGASRTNLTVVTDARLYNFDLEAIAAPDASTPYALRFKYEPQAGSSETQPDDPKITAHYVLSGAKPIMPAAVTDDGRATYVEWAPDRPIPAIFLVGDDNKEHLINGAYRDGRYVIDQVGKRIVFRLQSQTATALRVVDKARVKP